MTSLPKPHIFKPEDSKPLRWGIFGAGWIAEQMIKTVQKNSQQNFVAVASRTPGKAEEFAKSNTLIDKNDIFAIERLVEKNKVLEKFKEPNYFEELKSSF